jgi:ATP-binding cassette subfamily C protein
MRLLITFARRYPLHSVIVLFALLLAGIAEGFGLTALLPVLGSLSGSGLGKEALSSEGASNLAHYVTQIITALGLSPTIGVLLLVVVTGIALKSVFMLLANKRVGYTVAHVATDLRLAFLRALLSTRWRYYLDQPVGGLANAFATEATRASQAYYCGAKMAALLVQATLYASIAFLISWKAMLASIVAGAFLLYGLNRFVRMARSAGARQTSLLHSSLASLTDSLQSIKPLKAMAREDLADAVLEAETNRLNKALQKQVFSKEALRSLQEPMFAAFLALGIYVTLVYWALPLASIMFLLFLLAGMVNRLTKVQREYQKMVIFESAYWSLQMKIKDAEHEREPAFGERTPSLELCVRLDGVDFKYGDCWILKSVSLEFPAGSFTAITGPSGAGKTTVADLIMGLLRPQGGQIWIDDSLLSTVDIRSWRRMIGYIPQETMLLHDTVMRNVTLGAPELSEQDVENALRAAGIWNFVAALPQGVHNSVGERGGKLSGGQRQRIAIARALVHKPAMLILDEATSGLDPENEASICDTLRELRGKLTILAISHQPALVTAADRSYRVQDGTALLLEKPQDIDPNSIDVGVNQA